MGTMCDLALGCAVSWLPNCLFPIQPSLKAPIDRSHCGRSRLSRDRSVELNPIFAPRVVEGRAESGRPSFQVLHIRAQPGCDKKAAPLTTLCRDITIL